MDWAPVITSLESLLQTVFDELGSWETVGLVTLVLIFFMFRRLYLDRRKDKDSDRAIKAMEVAVQRAAQEAREWRVMFFSEIAGWDINDAERIVREGNFSNPIDARRELENG